MTSTFVNDLRLNEMATGDQSGSWGTVTNTNLELIGEALGFGTQQVFPQDQDATTTVADGAADPARAMYFKVTSAGNLTATRTMTVAPNTVSRLMFIENATSGSQAIAVSQGSGANVTIPTGVTKVVYLDGAGGGAAVVDAFAALSVVDLIVSDDLVVGDDASVGGILGVTGVLTTTAATVFNGGFASNADSTMGTDKKLIFRDSAIHISSTADGDLSIAADDEIDITSTLIDVNGNLDVSGTALVTGILTTTAATVFNGGFTANEVSTISDATSFSSGLTIANTADTHGSVIDFFNNSSSPADNDYIGGLVFKETNSAGGTHPFAKIFGVALDITDGTEDGALTFETSAAGAATAERMRIDQVGNILVGKGATDSGTNGIELNPSGFVYITADNTLPLFVNRRGTSGLNEFVRFADDAATIGKIVGNGGRLNISSDNGSSGGGIRLDSAIRPTDRAGTTTDGANDLGAAAQRWRDLYLSGGVKFDTNGEFLDDYEEGTHGSNAGVTNLIVPNTSGSVTVGFGILGFTKVGRVVTLSGEITIAAISSPAGGVTITLPFPQFNANGSNDRQAFTASKVIGYSTDFPDNGSLCLLNNADNTSTAQLVYEIDNATFGNYTPAAGDILYFQHSYYTSA